MYKSRLYKSLPVRGQDCAVSVRGGVRRLLREAPPFAELLRTVRRSQWLSNAELAAMQQERLQALLSHTMQYVPYYRDSYSGLGLDAASIISGGNWHRLPYLTKALVVQNHRRFIATGWRLHFSGSTSGTTGTPLEIIQDLPAIRREHAFVTRQMEWAGIRPTDRRAWLRADLVAPVDQSVQPFWRYNLGERMLMFSSFHLSEENCADYLRQLERYDPHVIQAFPSSISYLGRYLEAAGAEFRGNNLKAVVTSSEVITGRQREIITRRFGVPVFDWYGSAERVAAIGTCEHGRYHLLTDYGYGEYLPLDERRVELVATGFGNYAMPFIKYRTGDVLTLPASEEACKCGRAFPLVDKIEGRSHDYVITPDGRLVFVISPVMHNVGHVLEAQIIQEARDQLRVLVVPYGRITKADRERVVKNAKAYFGEDMKLSVEEVAAIPRNAAGKFSPIINKVARDGVVVP